MRGGGDAQNLEIAYLLQGNDASSQPVQHCWVLRHRVIDLKEAPLVDTVFRVTDPWPREVGYGSIGAKAAGLCNGACLCLRDIHLLVAQVHQAVQEEIFRQECIK